MKKRSTIAGYIETKVWKATLDVVDGWTVALKGTPANPDLCEQYRQIIENDLNYRFPPVGRPPLVRGFSAAAGHQWAWALHKAGKHHEAEVVQLLTPTPAPKDPQAPVLIVNNGERGELVMELEGWVRNGAIVLNTPATLPEGARVRVIVEEAVKQPTLAGLLKYAGALPDMPADFTEQHDHYIHGTPKR